MPQWGGAPIETAVARGAANVRYQPAQSTVVSFFLSSSRLGSCPVCLKPLFTSDVEKPALRDDDGQTAEARRNHYALPNCFFTLGSILSSQSVVGAIRPRTCSKTATFGQGRSVAAVCRRHHSRLSVKRPPSLLNCLLGSDRVPDNCVSQLFHTFHLQKVPSVASSAPPSGLMSRTPAPRFWAARTVQ